MSLPEGLRVSATAGRVTLILAHANDLQAEGVRKYLESLTKLGVIRRVYWHIIEEPLSVISGDFQVEALQKSGSTVVRLFETLSVAGGVTAVDVVALTVSDLVEVDLDSLTTTVPAVLKAFERWLRDAPVSDIRVCAPAYDKLLPDERFFSPLATARIVVMPLDPSHDYSVFRPFSGEQPIGMTGHVAVELASLLGCWSIQHEVPVDAFGVTSSGSRGSGIHLVISSVRALAVPAPPVSEALGSEAQLPVPGGFTAVPRPERLAESLAGEIYPSELKFQSQSRPEGPTEFASIDRFVFRFLKQFAAAVFSLPRVIRQGIQHEMDDLAITSMEDAIGGAASSVGLISTRQKRTAGEPLNLEVLIERMIENAKTDLDQNYRFGISAQDWQSISSKILTLADGNGEPTTRLLKDDAVISSISVLVPPCDASSSGLDVVRHLLDLKADTPTPSIIENISKKFSAEISKASLALASAIQQLRELPGVIRSRPEIKGDEIIRIGAVVGAALIVVSIGAFSPVRPIFAFEWLPTVIRDATWAFSAVLGMLLAVWALLHLAMKSDRARRIVDVISSLVIPIVLLTLLVQFVDIRRWAMQNGGGSNYRYALGLFVVSLVLAVLAIRQALESPHPKHKVLARAGVAIGSAYLVAAALIGLAQNEPPMIEGLPDARIPIFVVLFPSALISFGISVSRIAIARVREIYKALLAGRLIEWGIDELRRGSDAEIRLEVLRVQWAALGAVLTRTIRFPLGRNLVSILEYDHAVTGENDPLKLDFARLNLTNRGRGGLEARLRHSVVRQGWLNQQFSAIFRSYSMTAKFDRGLTEDEISKIDPLSCTSTPTAEEVGHGTAKGDRWALVDDLFGGAFEDLLRLPAEEIRFDSLYESVLLDPKSVQVVGAAHDSNGVEPFLAQSISNKQLSVPVGFLNFLVTGADSRLEMKRLVWWPTSLVEMSSTNRPGELEIRDSELLKPWEEYGTRIAMSVQVNWSEPFAYGDLTITERKLSQSVPKSSQDLEV